jgi:hypothetical protein
VLTLQVKDRRDGGRLRSTVLVPAHYEGQRYFVSMLGDGSEWVQNVRTSSREAFVKRGRSSLVILTEIPPEARAPIFKAWCQVATSGRRHLPVPYDAPESAFKAIATDYPVFRIDVPTSRHSKAGGISGIGPQHQLAVHPQTRAGGEARPTNPASAIPSIAFYGSTTWNDYVLQIAGGTEQPRPDKHLGELVSGTTCALAFDLVKEVTPQG